MSVAPDLTNKPLLSICIPTYNRAPLLEEAISSVLDQIDQSNVGLVELVISDNASTDATWQVVAQFAEAGGSLIRYYRNERNLGPDANILLSVERASGRYAWILGDDDLIVRGAINRMLGEIRAQAGIDVYLGEKNDFRLTVDRPMRFRRIMRSDKPAVYDFSQPDVMDRYFRENNRLIAYCNFISNLVFDRNKLLQIGDRDRFVGSGYNHVYFFQSLLWGCQRGVMKYIPVPLIARRWGTDGPAGPEERLNMEVAMFRQIAAAVFSDKKYLRRLDDLVLINDGFSWAVRVKTSVPRRFYLQVFPFLWHNYWNVPRFWLKIIPLLFVPAFLLRFMRGFYRRVIKGEPLSVIEMFEA